MAQKTITFDIQFNKVLTELEEFSPRDRSILSLGLDYPNVKKVIQIALKLTKENKLITSELLYNTAKIELKIPKWGLNKIIQMLIKKKILVDGSKLTKITVLNNNIRRCIYRLIRKNIGAHFSFLKEQISVQKECKMGVGQLNWHLKKLLEFNLIKKVKVKNYVLFLPIEIDNDIGIINFMLRDETNRKIVDFILEQEIINNCDLQKQLNVKREILYYHLKNLIEFNILSLLIEDERKITINLIYRDLINEIMSKFSTVSF